MSDRRDAAHRCAARDRDGVTLVASEAVHRLDVPDLVAAEVADPPTLAVAPHVHCEHVNHGVSCSAKTANFGLRCHPIMPWASINAGRARSSSPNREPRMCTPSSVVTRNGSAGTRHWCEVIPCKVGIGVKGSGSHGSLRCSPISYGGHERARPGLRSIARCGAAGARGARRRREARAIVDHVDRAPASPGAPGGAGRRSRDAAQAWIC